MSKLKPNSILVQPWSFWYEIRYRQKSTISFSVFCSKFETDQDPAGSWIVVLTCSRLTAPSPDDAGIGRVIENGWMDGFLMFLLLFHLCLQSAREPPAQSAAPLIPMFETHEIPMLVQIQLRAGFPPKWKHLSTSKIPIYTNVFSSVRVWRLIRILSSLCHTKG